MTTVILSKDAQPEKIPAASSQPGIQIGVSKSDSLPPGFYVPPIPFAALIANGWTPPPEASETQEPTGSFFVPRETP